MTSTRSLYGRCLRIGNATSLTSWMIGIARDPAAPDNYRNMAHANWNLDSDRGYGYKTWRVKSPSEIFTQPVPEAFVNEMLTPGLDVPCP